MKKRLLGFVLAGIVLLSAGCTSSSYVDNSPEAIEKQKTYANLVAENQKLRNEIERLNTKVFDQQDVINGKE